MPDVRFGYDGLTKVRFDGRRFESRGHYGAICINAQSSTSLHFKPPKPYLKNISKIYMWITCG
jgi:hypothetical protein